MKAIEYEEMKKVDIRTVELNILGDLDKIEVDKYFYLPTSYPIMADYAFVPVPINLTACLNGTPALLIHLW